MPHRLLAFALATVLAAAAAAGTPGLEPAQRDQLEQGATLVEWESVHWSAEERGAAESEAQRAIVGRRLLAAPPERIVRAVTDYRNYDEFMPFLVESTVIDGDADRAEVEHVLQPPFPARRRTCRVVLRGPGTADAGGPWLTRWQLVPESGNVREHRGEWEISRYDAQHALVVFRWSLDPGGMMPRGLTERAIEQSVPWVLDGLRQHIQRCRYDVPPPPGCNDG